MCQMSEKLDLVIIGAGAAGLACAIEAKRRSLKFCVIEKGTVVDSISVSYTHLTLPTKRIV